MVGRADPRWGEIVVAVVAPKEGRGWMHAAGGLAMTAHDLALWNLSVIDQSLLKPESYRELAREVIELGQA